jgi:hypothetical protein
MCSKLDIGVKLFWDLPALLLGAAEITAATEATTKAEEKRMLSTRESLYGQGWGE